MPVAHSSQLDRAAGFMSAGAALDSNARLAAHRAVLMIKDMLQSFLTAYKGKVLISRGFEE